MVKTVGVEFFRNHRDWPGSVRLREGPLEEHWCYMDRYQTEMIACGPTLAGDGDTPTSSVHIVGLPDPAAARVRLRRAELPGRRVPGRAAAPVAQPTGARTRPPCAVARAGHAVYEISDWRIADSSGGSQPGPQHFGSPGQRILCCRRPR
jgi:hypothetical protein